MGVSTVEWRSVEVASHLTPSTEKSGRSLPADGETQVTALFLPHVPINVVSPMTIESEILFDIRHKLLIN
jgi:hypothetical protein